MSDSPNADLMRLVQTACLPVDSMHLDRPEIRALPAAWQVRITIHAALAYLHVNGMIDITPDSEWPEWLALQVPDGVTAAIDADLARFAAVNARLP